MVFPHVNGINSIYSIMQISGQCASLMDYVTEASENEWQIEVPNHQMRENDIVEISLLVEHNNDIYYKNETRIFSDNQLRPYKISESQSMSSENCESKIKYILDEDCKQSQTISKGLSLPCAKAKIFEEEFEQGPLDLATWTHDIRSRVHVEAEELVAFDNQQGNCFVKDGVLHIRPTANENVANGMFSLDGRCTAIHDREKVCKYRVDGYTIKPPVISAQIHTRNSFSFKYGRVDIKAKLPIGDWLFPHLILQPMSTKSETLYAKQIRIAFARGNMDLVNNSNVNIGGDHLYGGLLTWPEEGHAFEIYKENFGDKHFGSDFHVYSIEWKMNSMTFSVDDKVYGVVDRKLEEFNEEMFLIIGVTVGGFLNFKDTELKPKTKPYFNGDPKASLLFWRMKDMWHSTWKGNEELQIDYIRVFSV